jgi:hypothetical protein
VSQADASSQKQYHRFYAPQLPPAAGISIELDPEEAKHAVRVLRLQPGQSLSGQAGPLCLTALCCEHLQQSHGMQLGVQL